MATLQKTLKASTGATAHSQRLINAVVVSAGLMDKTVKVRIGTQKWNAHIRKNFNKTAHLLVHDPRSSLRTGDVVAITPGWRASKHVHHVVDHIIAPFGEPIDARPAVMSEAERVAEREAQRAAKVERRRLRDLERGGERDVRVERGSEDLLDGGVVEEAGGEVLSRAERDRREHAEKVLAREERRARVAALKAAGGQEGAEVDEDAGTLKKVEDAFEKKRIESEEGKTGEEAPKQEKKKGWFSL
ncbi:hypothetical protein B0O99DRAFT_630393 [Bisporella sp. PMI_857]|nr:hypothetical protein B0O99DRAFT_630393 [Bisporella sp. PMI_857]